MARRRQLDGWLRFHRGQGAAHKPNIAGRCRGSAHLFNVPLPMRVSRLRGELTHERNVVGRPAARGAVAKTATDQVMDSRFLGISAQHPVPYPAWFTQLGPASGLAIIASPPAHHPIPYRIIAHGRAALYYFPHHLMA